MREGCFSMGCVKQNQIFQMQAITIKLIGVNNARKIIEDWQINLMKFS